MRGGGERWREEKARNEGDSAGLRWEQRGLKGGAEGVEIANNLLIGHSRCRAQDPQKAEKIT